MFSPRNALGIFLYANVVSWLLLLIINLIAITGLSDQPLFSFDFHLKGLLLNFFILLVFFYFKTQVEKIQELDFIDLLTNLFVTGLICNTISLIVQLVSANLISPSITNQDIRILNVLYSVYVACIVVFLTQAFFYWKKMILYEKTHRLTNLWNFFEYFLLISLLFNFFNFDLNHAPFAITLISLMIFGLILSSNLNWVAYLNSKEKWQGILLLLFITIFLIYFLRLIIIQSENSFLFTDLSNSVYVLAVGGFITFYAVFSILVILFNLPTTSVFEKRTEEIITFQKLAQALQVGQAEEEVYEILLENAASHVDSDAAWLEIIDEEGYTVAFLTQHISKSDAEEIKRLMKSNRLTKVVDNTFSRQNQKDKLMEGIWEFGFESIYVAPLTAHERYFGSLVLLKKVASAFDRPKRQLINTIVLQASISIENFRLLSKTIETERYKEEIKIAQNIQKRLLPTHLNTYPLLDIFAFSRSAYEVGGDYYDFYLIDECRILLIVADISGKGTIASFSMAQMKGIFHGLAQLNFSPEKLLFLMNNALKECLDKSSFVTATIAIIDTKEKEIKISRAGHCPTLYYHSEFQKTEYFDTKGMGLGIVRTDAYQSYIETQSLKYFENDILILYTDGIIEAKDLQEEEYGYERLEKVIQDNIQHSSKVINQKVIEDLELFTAEAPTHDDHTLLVVKFKEGLV